MEIKEEDKVVSKERLMNMGKLWTESKNLIIKKEQEQEQEQKCMSSWLRFYINL